MPIQSSSPLDTHAEGPSPWALVTAVGFGTVIAVALGLATATMSEGSETRPRAAVGQVFLDRPTVDEETVEDAGEVILPWQRLRVGVGEPERDLPNIRGAPADVAPPEGGSFVPVETAAVEGGDVAYVATGRPLQSEARVVLTADGREYPIDGVGGLTQDPNDPSTMQGRIAWVAVEGDPSTIEVTVVTGGQEQTVDVDGSTTRRRAADLEELSPREEAGEQESVDCGSSRRVDDADVQLQESDPEACTVSHSLRTPFVDGLGWAPEGREYLVVHVTRDRYLRVAESGDEGGPWDVTGQTDARLGGTLPRSGPANVNDLNEGSLVLKDVDDPEQFVFEVAEGRSGGDLVVRLDVDVRPEDPFATSGDTERLRLEWTIPARRLA